MLTDKKVKAFVATSDSKEAKKFYNITLGFTLISEDPYGLEFEMNNALLRINTVPDHQPQKYTVMGWIVPDVNEAIKSLKKKGVIFEKFEFMEQDEANIWAAPDGTKIAWFKDPSGNLLSINDNK
jgi:predicted enzyme related to lactoylglutathione lyase